MTQQTKVGSMVRPCINGTPGLCKGFVLFIPGPVTSLITVGGVVHSVKVYGKFYRSWIVVKDSTRKVISLLDRSKTRP